MFLCRLVGDVLLATGFLSYSGPFNQTFRSKLRENWQAELTRRRIPFTDSLNIIAMLVDNATVSDEYPNLFHLFHLSDTEPNESNKQYACRSNKNIVKGLQNLGTSL